MARQTVLDLRKKKADNQKIVMVTAYDYTMARLVDAAGPIAAVTAVAAATDALSATLELACGARASLALRAGPGLARETRLTLEDARALIRSLQAAGEDAEAILARLDDLDRDALHEILREEGIRVRLFGSGKRDK